jgi:hypothetical protein
MLAPIPKPALNKSPMEKQHILSEIRRTAQANGGVPLGRERFARETGIKYHDWIGKVWARWGDALREAGFEPNKLQTAYDDDLLIEKFIGLTRELGRFPVYAELRMKARSDPSFPAHNTFARLGSKPQIVPKILAYCERLVGYEDIVALCTNLAAGQQPRESEDNEKSEDAATTKEGYVYMGLLKLGREKRYKIGKSVFVKRRTDQISLQLPEDLELVHAIRTDDAHGIESYWHRRFAPKNTKGEWFSLSREDVQAFKRRKFM